MTLESPETAGRSEPPGGETLETRLQRNPGGLPWKTATRIFEQCIEALIRRREAGGGHRHISPARIFLPNDGSVTFIDFDIATQAGAASVVSNESPAPFDYMSPDFARMNGFVGDEQSDIFSLGVAFYHALTGRLPYQRFGPSADAEYLHRWRTGTEPGLSFQPQVFRVLEPSAAEFFRLAIEPDRSRRFKTLADMLGAIRNIRSRTVSGKDTYELEEVLGHGGFGEVFMARGVRDGRHVAIKRLFEDLQSRRFIKEARLLQRLHHQHLVEYVDFVDVESVANSHNYFLVMELLPGMPDWTLRSRIGRSPNGLELVECLALFSHYLECLDYLHGRKIIHRDIKPANLYAPEGNPNGAKVFDLGIARDVGGTATTGFVPGTLEYMPPELGREGGERGSPRSDIYSTGLSLYEALTGKPAYKRLPADERAAFKQFLKRTDSPGEQVDFTLPLFNRYPALADIVRKAIDVQPGARYTSAAEMQRAIDAVRADLRVASERTTAERAATRAETAATIQPASHSGDSSDTFSRAVVQKHASLRKILLTGSVAAAAIFVAIAAGVGLMSQVIIPGTITPNRPKHIYRADASAPKVPQPPVISAPVSPPAPPAQPAQPPAVVSAPVLSANSAAELSVLALAIEGETCALLESFSLSMAETVSLECKRAEFISARLTTTAATTVPEDVQLFRNGLERLVLAATNQVQCLAAANDIATLTDWPRLAPTLAAIPAVKYALERATANTETSLGGRAWFDRIVAMETDIADLTSTSTEAAIRRLKDDFAALELEAAGRTGRVNQVSYLAERIASRFGAIADELCGGASHAYTNDNIKAGDQFRSRVESLKSLIPPRFGRAAIDRRLAKCGAEREKATSRIVDADQKRLAAATLAAQARARGTKLEPGVLPGVPPVTVTYRLAGTGLWSEVRMTNLPVFLQPGTYSFRFTRPDFKPVETARVIEPGVETVTVPVPARWSESDQLVALHKAEKLIASEPRDLPALNSIFEAPSPSFEWEGNATRFQDLRGLWERLHQEQVAAAVNSAEEAVGAYTRWLYQVQDPATGAYRRYKSPMPAIIFKLPAPAGTNVASGNEQSAQFKRLEAWENASGSLLSDSGQADLARVLAQCSVETAAVSKKQSALCIFESALLLSKPGKPDASMEKLQGPDEVACWRAHSAYTPRASSIETLRHLASYAVRNAVTNDFDINLALFSAFYTWRNAVAGERQYALEVNTALGTILSGMDAGLSEKVISSLESAILKDDTSSQGEDPYLYMMNAMSLMPGLAHGSELKRRATSWLGAHGADPAVARKEAEMRQSLDLLKSLLQAE